MINKKNNNLKQNIINKPSLAQKLSGRKITVNLKNMPVPKRFSSLRSKLILVFLVPILFIILLGISSFQMASSAIEEKYRETAIQVVGKTAEYISYGLKTVENTSYEYTNNKDISKYLTYTMLGGNTDMFLLMSSIQNEFVVKSTVDDFIFSIYIIPENGPAISTKTSVQLDSDTYKGILETEIVKKLSESNKIVWSGKDAYIDEKLGTNNSNYSLRLIQKYQSHQALLVIDVQADTIQNILDRTDLDDTGILAFVTADGKEIAKNSNDTLLFSEQTFYKKAAESAETQGSKTIKLNGKSYLFMYSKVGETGAMICSLIPEATITGQASKIRSFTILIVIIACIIAVFTGIFIATGIDKTIKGIISGLRKAAQGDLTVEFHTNRNDEFRTLINEIQNTFSNMKDLISQVNLLSGKVEDSSSQVNQTSLLFLKNTENITRAINEIEQGVMQQAKDAEECLMQMDNLSNKIKLVSDNTKEIGHIANNVKEAIIEGTDCTNELNIQTKSTIEITTNIINAIEVLAEKSVVVTKIINVIQEIANQTSLLSLNASIEAARAGEYGRGFSVVANEIRNLAEKSSQSVKEIQKIINSIMSDTKSAVETAKKVESVIDLQENAVNNTISSYNKINESVEKLIIYLNHISESVDNIEGARVSTLNAIENISAVLEEVAASTGSVGQTANDQLKSVEALNESADILKENAGDLSQAIQKFTV